MGFVERPLVLGFAWWIYTGDVAPALPLALFFELFWLDLYPIGSFIPPMAAFPYLLLMGLSRHFGWGGDPASIAFPLAVTLPLAYAIPRLEIWQRDTQKSASALLVKQAQQQEVLFKLTQTLIRRSVLQQLCLGLALFWGLSLAVAFAFSYAISQGSASFIPLDVDWSVLYAIAAIGAVVALRVKRAYLVFAFSMGALLACKLFL